MDQEAHNNGSKTAAGPRAPSNSEECVQSGQTILEAGAAHRRPAVAPPAESFHEPGP